MKRKLIMSLGVLLASCGMLKAQNVGIKTNVLADAALSPNLGIEVGLAPKWSLDISGEGNFWTVNGHKWKHWLAEPEIRFWPCDRFSGNFIAVHGIVGQYNFGNIKNGIKFLGSDFSQLTDNRYQGWGYGAGVAYGYAWILGKHWNLEAEIGIGWIRTKFDKYPCEVCGTKIGSGTHDYFGPTKLALNFMYIF